MIMSFSLPGLLNWLMAASPYSGHTRSDDPDPGHPGGDGPPPFAVDVRRIMETLLPAAVVGIIVMWGSMQVIGNDMETCKERIERIEHLIDRIHSDIYGPRWELPHTEPYGDDAPAVWRYFGPPDPKPTEFLV